MGESPAVRMLQQNTRLGEFGSPARRVPWHNTRASVTAAAATTRPPALARRACTDSPLTSGAQLGLPSRHTALAHCHSSLIPTTCCSHHCLGGGQGHGPAHRGSLAPAAAASGGAGAGQRGGGQGRPAGSRGRRAACRARSRRRLASGAGSSSGSRRRAEVDTRLCAGMRSRWGCPGPARSSGFQAMTGHPTHLLLRCACAARPCAVRHVLCSAAGPACPAPRLPAPDRAAGSVRQRPDAAASGGRPLAHKVVVVGGGWGGGGQQAGAKWHGSAFCLPVCPALGQPRCCSPACSRA